MVRCAIVALALACAAGCDGDIEPSVEDSWRAALGLPDGFPLPSIPDANPPSAEKVTLGRHLFYDARLSGNGTQSCASCHKQELAFADGVKAPVGSTGDALVRNSQGLANAAYNATLTWANNGLTRLEDQLEVPIRNDHPTELGVTDGNVAEVLARFDADPSYAAMFAAAFPDSESGATVDKIIFALATFVRSLVSYDSPYDRFLAGDEDALSPSARRGLVLFNGEKFECFHCHSGMNISISYRDNDSRPGSVSSPFFNNGLYNVGNAGDYPPQDQGLFDVTRERDDRGRFRPQSLRNVALTAPYMHDGSIATLRDVVKHYAAGGRNITDGPLAGDGRLNPIKSGLVRAFLATEQEIDDVVAFLESLTDETFVTNPAFSDPFAGN